MFTKLLLAAAAAASLVTGNTRNYPEWPAKRVVWNA